MAAKPVEQPFLGERDLKALRELVGYARSVAGIQRGEIARKAQVSPGDIDNFIRTRRRADGANQYRSKRPSFLFQLRILRYLGSPEAETRLKKPADLFESLARTNLQILKPKIELASLMSDDDESLFRHLYRIEALDDSTCREMASEIEGNYLMYRFSSNGRSVVPSFIEVKPYNCYSKVTAFNHYKLEDHSVRFTNGIVLAAGGDYIFNGLIHGTGKRPPDKYVGTKIIILKRGPYPRATSFSGVFLSRSEKGDYEFGATYIKRTPDEYSRKVLENAPRTPSPPQLEAFCLSGVDFERKVRTIQSSVILDNAPLKTEQISQRRSATPTVDFFADPYLGKPSG